MQRCDPQHDCSGSQGSTERPCRSLCPGRRIGYLPCSGGRFAGSGSGSCSPYLPAKSTCSPANALVHGRRYTFSYLKTRESRTCCLHGKTGPSGRWHTAQTAPPENTQPRSSVNLLLCRWDDLLGQEPQIVVRTTGAGSSIFESRRTVPGYHVVVPVQIADGYQCK